MAKFEPERGNIVEAFVDFNPSSDYSVSVSSIRSLALSKKSDSETLLYVGSASGNLLLLSLNPARNPSENDVSNAKNVTFMRYVRISDRSVDYIHVVTAIDKVLVVSGGFIYFLDPLLLQPLKKLSSLRGVSVVARRVRSRQTDSPNTSVGGYSGSSSSSTTAAVDKRLMLLGLDSTGESLVILEEYQCPNGVNSLVWLDDSIIIGAAGGYYLYSCVAGQSALICSLPDPSTPPYLKLLSKENQVLLLVDNVGVTVNAQGQPVGGSLVFREAPDSVGELARYLVVVKNGKMELYHKKSGNSVQMIPFSGEGVGPFIVADEEDGSGKVVAVATPSKPRCGLLIKNVKKDDNQPLGPTAWPPSDYRKSKPESCRTASGLATGNKNLSAAPGFYCQTTGCWQEVHGSLLESKLSPENCQNIPPLPQNYL
ncbi:hypothetical protein RJ639_029939 [Escallonia herrerae]|uniref:CNH domain-containing protein n=1 Tax=Escallonia herrerae TaxID=1293975 RepID=A0AA89BHV4_9ASTE|nr:hypothetical protein RJ639_029939 [Escallonia herrerae]